MNNKKEKLDTRNSKFETKAGRSDSFRFAVRGSSFAFLPLIFLALSACTHHPAAQTQPAIIEQQAPHSMKVTRALPKQVTFERYAVDLTLHNTYDKPMWFITRRAGEVKLNEEAKFLPGTLKDPLILERYYGYEPGGSILRITGLKFMSYKKREGGFKAFLLPPGANLTIHDWELTIYEGRKAEFEVIEASKITINHEKPIEEWAELLLLGPQNLEAWNLQLNESSTQPATSPADTRVSKLKIWSRQAEQAYYANATKLPKGELYMVQAEEVKRYVLPIEGYVYVAPKEEKD